MPLGGEAILAIVFPTEFASVVQEYDTLLAYLQ